MSNLWKRLFGSKQAVSSEPNSTVIDVMKKVRQPAIQLQHTWSPSRSHFGGDPRLAEGVPSRNGKTLAFIARLSLPELQAAHPISWLPVEGALLFFHDFEADAWGFDPKDRGSFAVLHVPDLPEPIEASLRPQSTPLPHRNIRCAKIEVAPSAERMDATFVKQWSESDWDDASECLEGAFGGAPRHQVSGYPYPIQGDHMELESQLVSNGLYCGNEEGYRDPRAKALEPGARNWRLLLQVDSDEALDVMWGDAGMLYFWVEESRAIRGDFSNVWAIQQCH